MRSNARRTKRKRARDKGERGSGCYELNLLLCREFDNEERRKKREADNIAARRNALALQLDAAG